MHGTGGEMTNLELVQNLCETVQLGFIEVWILLWKVESIRIIHQT